ncbi:hypothetical protein BT96DRAFT_279177 [Gymnopus androsaceus JB14]|uniref:Uncharacterized protein n=1 Tax=Gymnopus androsaceus JB14 TaxID=1447944 RepID=A0A6A4H3D1_9AGAR|nr:hypothetical protein BT96DRAFT_279177 [Gymnopus androsaceus JB14]
MTRKLKKRFGRRIRAISIKWTPRLFASSSATSSSPDPFIQLPDELASLVARAWAILSQHGIFREIVLEFSRAKLHDSANEIKHRKLLHYLHRSSRCRNINSSTFSRPTDELVIQEA